MSTELGRLEDLPADYRAALTERNLVPLWPNLRGVLPPGKPRPKTRATHWPYASIKPLLLQAGELTPIEKAERRVLVLANPGHGLDNMQASAAMYLGMQLLLPGEWAPSHRHTPNAVRMVVEGEGAWSLVDGEKCPMSRGDLILTPGGTLDYTPEPADYAYRPSVNVFFHSLARHWRAPAIGVLLTGMGRDGATGLLALRETGCHTIAQDRESSAIYGMPKGAADLGAAAEILALGDIAPALLKSLQRTLNAQ